MSDFLDFPEVRRIKVRRECSIGDTKMECFNLGKVRFTFFSGFICCFDFPDN